MSQKLSKKEARLLRGIDKLAKQKEKSVRLNSSIEIKDKFIRIGITPKLEKKPRSLSPDNYKKCYLTWCTAHSDTDGVWKWGNNEPRQWTEEELTVLIAPHLDSYTNNSWGEVESKSYNGKKEIRKLLNKYQPLGSICKEAQLRWMDLDLVSQFEELFRFRLGSSRRIWGVRVQHHFYLVWYERHHKICPIK